MHAWIFEADETIRHSFHAILHEFSHITFHFPVSIEHALQNPAIQNAASHLVIAPLATVQQFRQHFTHVPHMLAIGWHDATQTPKNAHLTWDVLALPICTESLKRKIHNAWYTLDLRQQVDSLGQMLRQQAMIQALQQAPNAAAAIAKPREAARDTIGLAGVDGHIKKLEALEQEIIQYALNKYDQQRSEVARRLGIGRSTLYRKLQEQEPQTAQATQAA